VKLNRSLIHNSLTSGFKTVQSKVMAAADAIIDVQVNGLSGPVCTLQAHMGWSIAVFKAALAQRLDMRKEALRLLHGHGEAVLDAEHFWMIFLVMVSSCCF
jgi:hypothetical protein